MVYLVDVTPEPTEPPPFKKTRVGASTAGTDATHEHAFGRSRDVELEEAGTVLLQITDGISPIDGIGWARDVNNQKMYMFDLDSRVSGGTTSALEEGRAMHATVSSTDYVLRFRP